MKSKKETRKRLPFLLILLGFAVSIFLYSFVPALTKYSSVSAQSQKETEAACENFKDNNKDFKACQKGYKGGFNAEDQGDVCGAGEGQGGGTPELIACQDGFTSGELAKGGGDDKDAKNTEADCVKEDLKKQKEDAKGGEFDEEKAQALADKNCGVNDASDECQSGFGFNLLWIVCGIIEFAQNISEFFYGEMIQPLLDDVPVSTNKKDGTYQVWQGFRLVANIILVGAMLILVYGLARGGR